MKRFFIAVLIVVLGALSAPFFACSSPAADPPEEVTTEYSVTFIVGDETYKTVQTDENGKITLPADPALSEAFTFDGWFLDENTWQSPFYVDTPITSDIEVYAKISRKIFSVKFTVGDETYKTVQTDENGKITLPADPVLSEAFTFDGWFLDENTWQSPFYVDTPITSDIEVYAKISRKIFSVTFIADGQIYQTVNADENGKITQPADPALGAGYVFEGWFFDDATFLIPFDPESKVTCNVTVYAKFYKYVLNPEGNATVNTLKIGSKVWSTNDYSFSSLPKAFIGKPYLLWTINGPNTATSIKSGWLYAITGEALTFGHEASQVEVLDGYNFTQIDRQFWNVWTAPLKNNVIFEKYVEAGETFTLGRWSVVVMSDEKLDLSEGEPMEKDERLAVLKPSSGDSVVNMALSAKVFSDRAYTFYDMPYWLAGKNYIQSGYASKTHTATVVKGGTAYMFTSKGGNISLIGELSGKGWTDVTETIPSDLNIFGDGSQKGAFLNEPYNGFALMKKELTEGETVSWGQWGLLVFSGEFTPASNVATLVPAAESTKAAKAEEEMRLFSNRTYYAMDGVPSGLSGLTYFLDGIETGATVKAVTSGTAYVMIPSGTTAYKSLENEVIAAGWSPVAYKPFRLAVGLMFCNRLYAKNVEIDEEIHFGKYNIIFGAAFNNASDYYVMPSLTTPAEIVTNPVGDKYDTDKQNWLGCPTVEKTSGGRVWSGWFTGGARELGTGNYAIIGYSDDDCVSWKKAVAVVHPDSAVQVTKPELWTAPN
ncbi:MAG: InlB B-repeat-containing protein, partial [Candidatus Neoclostridium sp.]